MKGLAIFAVAVIATALSIGVVSCSATDVVAKVADTSFKAVVDASGNRVAWSSVDEAWSLLSPSGDKVSFSTDFARTKADSGLGDLEFSFDAAPFIAAGLQIENLPKAEGLRYELKDDRFLIQFELGSQAFEPGSQKSFEATFTQVVKTQRDRIGYHAALDHYGIELGNGNMFEWAKDLAKNDKDIVWVLNPEPFITAGVDPARLEGWAFAQVETMDEAGKTVFVDKLLKPFNIK